MSGDLTPLEEDLLAALDPDHLARHAARLADALSEGLADPADETAPTLARDRAVASLREGVRGWGIPLALHHFDALMNAPEEARLGLARRNAPVPTIVHPYSASTPLDGLTAELRATGPATAATDRLAGAIALLDGPPTPALVAAVAATGALAQVYVGPDETPRPVPVAGPPATAPTPVVSIGRAAGEGFRALCAAGPTPVGLVARTAWRARRLTLPVATLGGVEEPDDFVVAGAALALAPDGRPDVAAAAGLLELCRVLTQQTRRLRRGLRLIWWPATTAPEAAAAAYVDHTWEELGRHAVAYVELRDLGRCGDGARTAAAAPALRSFAETALRDGGVALATMETAPLAGAAGHFARAGLPGLTLAAHHSPASGSADPSRLARDTALHALLLARLCTYPLLPFDPVATARAIESRLQAIFTEAGDPPQLAPLRARAGALRATAEQLRGATLRVAQGASTNYEEGLDAVNRALRRLNRLLTSVLGRAGDPYTATPPAPHLLPGLDSALALAALARASPAPDAATAHELRAATIRERNRLLDALGAATATLDETLAALRALGFG